MKSQHWRLITIGIFAVAWLFKTYLNKITTTKDNSFIDRQAYITYSNHAKCRMECRHISISEIKETLDEGEINFKKSEPQNKKFALEDNTKDNQLIRVVFAFNEPHHAHVITCIDLENEWPCHCN